MYERDFGWDVMDVVVEGGISESLEVVRMVASSTGEGMTLYTLTRLSERDRGAAEGGQRGGRGRTRSLLR